MSSGSEASLSSSASYGREAGALLAPGRFAGLAAKAKNL